jgi:hypothetical protein
MGTRKNDAIRPLRIKKTDDLKTIYAKVKRSFTAADLQAFAEEDEGIPADDVVADLEKVAGLRGRKPRKA